MNIPDISFPNMPWRKDRYFDVNIPQDKQIKEGDTITVKDKNDNEYDVKNASRRKYSKYYS